VKHYLDIESWPRKEHFDFFRAFEEPFFGITVPVDCQLAYRNAQDYGVSFFAYYLHCSLKAINAIECFRYRIEGDQVVVYDTIHASATIGRADGTFGFSFIPYTNDMLAFCEALQAESERIRKGSGLEVGIAGDDVVHYSSVPWLSFTSLSHARQFKRPDSVPKITFGKVHEEQGKRTMPVSLHAHHALLDGIHAGEHFALFQLLLNNPE
jgi:chloramphenicol O-acetyltransferase type A